MIKFLFIFIVIQFVSKVETFSLKKCADLETLNEYPLLNQICKSMCQDTSDKEFCHFYSNPTKLIILNRKKRGAIEDNIIPVTKIFVDSLVNTVKPSFGTRGFILDALKPFLVSIGTGFVKELMKFVKNILDQGPFIEAKTFIDQTYEAYPVFIPSYGAFVLLSKSGAIESMKNSSDMIEAGKSDCKDNCTASNITISSNETVSARENSELLKVDNKDAFKNFYIGEAHLIPINAKTETFENSRQIEEVYNNEEGTGPVKQYIKQVTETRSDIKSFKKRLLLSLLKKMEKAIREL